MESLKNIEKKSENKYKNKINSYSYDDEIEDDEELSNDEELDKDDDDEIEDDEKLDKEEDEDEDKKTKSFILSRFKCEKQIALFHNQLNQKINQNVRDGDENPLGENFLNYFTSIKNKKINNFYLNPSFSFNKSTNFQILFVTLMFKDDYVFTSKNINQDINEGIVFYLIPPINITLKKENSNFIYSIFKNNCKFKRNNNKKLYVSNYIKPKIIYIDKNKVTELEQCLMSRNIQSFDRLCQEGKNLNMGTLSYNNESFIYKKYKLANILNESKIQNFNIKSKETNIDEIENSLKNKSGNLFLKIKFTIDYNYDNNNKANYKLVISENKAELLNDSGTVEATSDLDNINSDEIKRILLAIGISDEKKLTNLGIGKKVCSYIQNLFENITKFENEEINDLYLKALKSQSIISFFNQKEVIYLLKEKDNKKYNRIQKKYAKYVFSKRILANFDTAMEQTEYDSFYNDIEEHLKDDVSDLIVNILMKKEENKDSLSNNRYIRSGFSLLKNITSLSAGIKGGVLLTAPLYSALGVLGLPLMGIGAIMIKDMTGTSPSMVKKSYNFFKKRRIKNKIANKQNTILSKIIIDTITENQVLIKDKKININSIISKISNQVKTANLVHYKNIKDKKLFTSQNNYFFNYLNNLLSSYFNLSKTADISDNSDASSFNRYKDYSRLLGTSNTSDAASILSLILSNPNLLQEISRDPSKLQSLLSKVKTSDPLSNTADTIGCSDIFEDLNKGKKNINNKSLERIISLLTEKSSIDEFKNKTNDYMKATNISKNDLIDLNIINDETKIINIFERYYNITDSKTDEIALNEIISICNYLIQINVQQNAIVDTAKYSVHQIEDIILTKLSLIIKSILISRDYSYVYTEESSSFKDDNNIFVYMKLPISKLISSLKENADFYMIKKEFKKLWKIK